MRCICLWDGAGSDGPGGTRHLVEALSKLSKRPSALVCASAIGIYGSRGDEILTEASAPANDYLAEVCQAWEREALAAESLLEHRHARAAQQ